MGEITHGVQIGALPLVLPLSSVPRMAACIRPVHGVVSIFNADASQAYVRNTTKAPGMLLYSLRYIQHDSGRFNVCPD